MNPQALREILEKVRRGEETVEEALEHLRRLPFEAIGEATIDHHRELRTGTPEVVFGAGKSAEQIAAIVERMVAHRSNVLVTRLTSEKAALLSERFPAGRHDPTARTFFLAERAVETTGKGTILVISAGTSDIPVAEEAAVTAEVMGNPVERMYDVGVAGVHRLLLQSDRLHRARVIIVVAGMEGALASVVGGLVSVPVIAVPTSIGYGASFQGLAALLGMLNSCAAGVAVVNIDNGFGAAYLASVINHLDREDR